MAGVGGKARDGLVGLLYRLQGAPRQHVVVLLLLCCYKSIAVLALLTHGVLGLLADKPVPLAVWAIAVLWLLQAVSNARLYPWGIED